MEAFYLYRFEIFFVSGLGFSATAFLIYLKENSISIEMPRFSRGPSSVLNKKVVDALKVQTAELKKYQRANKVKRARVKQAEKTKTLIEGDSGEDESVMKSSKSFFEQFDSLPLHLLAKEGALTEDVDSENYIERILTEEEKDAMKLALEMDEEVRSSKEVI